jgi:superfamily II DNA or RNA helicase
MTQTVFRQGEWVSVSDTGQIGRVVESGDLWGTQVCTVWMPSADALRRIPADRLAGVDSPATTVTAHHLLFVAAAARVADALERDALLAPLSAPVIPLPHQIYALSRAMGGDRVRYLLADEVGLGKTVEAGLVLRELKIRGLVRRVLVVAPAGLVAQWVQEMRLHFRETFHLMQPGSFGTLREATGLSDVENAWRLHDQVVCAMDSVKPMEGRRGWSQEQVLRYNRERFDDLVAAGWDLVIVDEAHRIAGSHDQVARYRLGEGLAQAAPYLLLLTATPHQGKTDGFRRLLSFLDSEAFLDDESIQRERVAPYVIRTEKRRAIDPEGEPLFKPRHTQLLHVAWGSQHQPHRALYEAVSHYVREGYDRAIRQRRNAVGFLMLLMQRIVTSSTRAIRVALERRLEVLQTPDTELPLFPEEAPDDWSSLDGQEQLDAFLASRARGTAQERAEVEVLLSSARRCEALRPDVKALELLELVRRIEREEGDNALKVLIFTEFVPTQEMLSEFLSERGYSVTCLNGSLDIDERQRVQREFATSARILVSTDAGGEGLNLQFCHVVVNYDLPWNPMKLEQRIGRVDRIGQGRVVRAVNLALADTVELRVREVLEEKLARIFDDLGIDKLSDVLDSEQGGATFEELYAQALLAPAEISQQVDAFVEEIRARARAAQEGARLLAASDAIDPSLAQRIAGHPLGRWTERMTVEFLRSQRTQGAEVSVDPPGYRLRWPDGATTGRVVFAQGGEVVPGAESLSVEDPRVRSLVERLALFAPGQPISAVEIPGVSDRVCGIWSLWRVALESSQGRERRLLPLFKSDDGRVLMPTARAVWDRLLESDGESLSVKTNAIDGDAAKVAYDALLELAREHGRPLYQELLAVHRDRLVRERRKGQEAFAARVRAVGRIGLAAVRAHRTRELEKDRAAWMERLAAREDAVPTLTAVVIVRVAAMGEAR